MVGWSVHDTAMTEGYKIFLSLSIAISHPFAYSNIGFGILWVWEYKEGNGNNIQRLPIELFQFAISITSPFLQLYWIKS